MSNADVFHQYREWMDDYLSQCLLENREYATLLESMRYSLLAGGKRIRPCLTLEFCRLCGGNVENALPVAAAVEMLHTYSLIHDDLPCMDNDTLRRGKATNHVVYGETVAVLAGDALQAYAFSQISRANLTAEQRIRCVDILAEAAGPDGICGGQTIDMEWEGRELSEAELALVHHYKTATLIEAACCMGVACGSGQEDAYQAAKSYAMHLGLAFQVRDDMLDVISSEKELGKNTGSDRAEDKFTFVSLYGLEKCDKIVLEETKLAKKALQGFEGNENLLHLADSLAKRRN